MTKPRAELWADEAAAAELSGMPAEKFRAHLQLLEAEGFPKPSPWNGKRYIPAIRAFWDKQAGIDTLLVTAAPEHHDADGKDRWGTNDRENHPRERRASR